MLLVGWLFGLVGCGGGAGHGPPRYPVHGKVTFKGQPLAKGTITFGAADAKKGTPDAASINNGSYEIDRGLAAGDYAVVVEEVSPSLREADKAKSALPKSKIPEKYAAAKTSDLKFTVKSGSNTADFDLKD
jgi:hypothetical protein